MHTSGVNAPKSFQNLMKNADIGIFRNLLKAIPPKRLIECERFPWQLRLNSTVIFNYDIHSCLFFCSQVKTINTEIWCKDYQCQVKIEILCA